MKTIKKQKIEQEILLDVLFTSPNGLSVEEIKRQGLDRHNSINILLVKKLIKKHNLDGSLPITKDTLMVLPLKA